MKAKSEGRGAGRLTSPLAFRSLLAPRRQRPSLLVLYGIINSSSSSRPARIAGAKSRRFSISATARPFSEKRASRADLDTLAAARARLGKTPRRSQFGRDQRARASAHHVPHMSAFHFGADPDAAATEHAAVRIHAVARVRGRPADAGTGMGIGCGRCRFSTASACSWQCPFERRSSRCDCARRRANSSVIRRSSFSSGVCVRTSMPSVTFVTQAGNSLLLPTTSTRHMRHAPTGIRPSR